ncbi:hypothetical protein [Erythrobacter aureus]|uniref:UrcA family protein n=1 Tax=Erythrobacter aureus TaxID=2182384 RepID=A0A345YJ65_9SPHN|nr:hypothetical protein [Erythrobacter aureus]AXK43967.1 hypothetical protein DVR09_16055 [Erythrobacter aureus]
MIAKPALLAALAMLIPASAHAQTAEEIIDGAASLSQEMESARRLRDSKAVCSLSLTINAEHKATRRLMLLTAKKTFDGIEGGKPADDIKNLSGDLGGYIAALDTLARLKGRADMACLMLTEAG